MEFRCPSCGLQGRVRIPENFPRVKKTKIRCAHCNKAFTLTIGKLWPQESESAYEALLPAAAGCRGEKIGPLWIEIKGEDSSRVPVLALQGHPALSHRIMHDLLDPLADYTRICFVEFPGSSRNPAQEKKNAAEAFLRSFMDVKEHLKTERLHLVCHLESCSLGLNLAAAHPQAISSLILIDPDLENRHRWEELEREGTPTYGHSPGPAEREDFLNFLFQNYWHVPLEDYHVRGLSRVLAPDFSYALFTDGAHSEALSYARLSKIKRPCLIVASQDGKSDFQEDAQYLKAAMPGAETLTLHNGGNWAAWISTAFQGKLLSFTNRPEKLQQVRSKTQTASGQPLGFMLLLFALITCGLSYLLHQIPYSPEYMRSAVPPLLGAVLPMLWLLFPRKIKVGTFLRFRAFEAGTVFLPLLVGLILGLSYGSLLHFAGPALHLPEQVPAFLLSPWPGSEGRVFYFVSLLFLATFVFGYVENLLNMRRSSWQVAVPLLLFLLIPPSYPDILWKIPIGLIAALCFRKKLSTFTVLFLLVGFFFASELPFRPPGFLVPLLATGLPGLFRFLPAAGLFIVGILTAVLGRPRKAAPAEVRYFAHSLNQGKQAYRWKIGLGIVFVVFSIIIAAILIGGFMKI